MVNRREAIAASIGAIGCAAIPPLKDDGVSWFLHGALGLKYHKIFSKAEWSIADNAWLLVVMSVNPNGGGYVKTSKHTSESNALYSAFYEAEQLAKHIVYLEKNHATTIRAY